MNYQSGLNSFLGPQNLHNHREIASSLSSSQVTQDASKDFGEVLAFRRMRWGGNGHYTH